MATVIDSLVVLLGLDASNYKKGREQAEKETSETARKVKASSEDLTKSLLDVGKTVAGLFLGFESATGFAKWLGALNSGEAQLGRTANQIGMSAHELNKWGNAAVLAGQSAEGVQSDFAKLTNDFSNLTAGIAGPTALLNILSQVGVNVRDSNGQLRNQGAIFEELADKTAQYGEQYQTALFRQAGLDEGHIKYLIETRQEREQQLRLSEQNNAVNEASVKQAQELQEYWRAVGLHIQAAGQMILTAVTPALKQLFSVFGEINLQSDEFSTGLKLIGSAAIAIKRIFVGVGDSVGGAAAAIGAALHGDFKGAAAILNDQSARSKAADIQADADIAKLWATQTAAQSGNVVTSATGTDQSGTDGYVGPKAGSLAARNNNPGNIQDRFGNKRKYASFAEGKAALEGDLAAKIGRGLTSVDALINAYEGGDTKNNNIPAYQAYVKNALGHEEVGKGDIAKLTQIITDYESGNTRRSQSSRGNSGGATTTVDIDTININAPQADPRHVAEQLPAAINRKLSVTQADTGQS
jgi:hypothetical protein